MTAGPRERVPGAGGNHRSGVGQISSAGCLQCDAGGTGGNININTPQMELTNQATAFGDEQGPGNAGNISLLIGNSLRLQDSPLPPRDPGPTRRQHLG